MNWTEEAIAEMHRLAGEGFSASRIGEILGMTRNAIIGKMHRTGAKLTRKPGGVALDARNTITRKPKRPAPSTSETVIIIPVVNATPVALSPAPRVIAPVPPRMVAAVPDIERATVPSIPYTPRCGPCQWPEGDPRSTNFRMCGDRVSPGSSYCPYHRKLAHQKPTGSKSTSLGNFKGRLGISGADK